LRRIPHSKLTLGAAEARALARVLRSGQLAGGPEVLRLEAEFAERFGFRYAVAVASGTAALHLSLLALGIGRGDRVLVPSYVCVAVLNAVRQAGAREQLADSALGDFHLDGARIPGARPHAAILPHLFGHAADPGPVLRAGIPVLEDCAMALGATTPRGRTVGRRGAAAIFSFYATKLITGGEGGLVATDDRGLADEVRDRRAYDKKDDWRLRFNYKLTDLQAALIRCQLRRVTTLIARRRELAARYDELLRDLDLIRPPRTAGSSYHRYVVRTDRGFEAIQGRLAAARIDVARPVHRPLHRLLDLSRRRFPNAEQLFLTSISIPIYPTLLRSAQERVARVLGSI